MANEEHVALLKQGVGGLECVACLHAPLSRLSARPRSRPRMTQSACIAFSAHPITAFPSRIDRPFVLIHCRKAKVQDVIHHQPPGAVKRQGVDFFCLCTFEARLWHTCYSQ